MGHDTGHDERSSALRRALVAMKTLRVKLDAAERRQSEPIAIIGMACRFPGGANTLESYWELLHNGTDAIIEVPSARWDIDAHYDPNPDTPGKMYTRVGGFLAEPVDQFDPAFFGISPREAVSMDPQQRLLLEVAWEGLERAGQAPDKLAGTSTGIFVGISTADYLYLLHRAAESTPIDAYWAVGVTASVAAGRLAYVLGVRGPCFPVDTACSSSLVSVHLAMQSLRRRECRIALAAGVGLSLTPETTICFCKLRALSPSGRCRTFDAGADGYVRGEGCGVVVLKRLSDALAEGDTIQAVLRGSAVNHDGRSGGLTVPNGPSQQALIKQALEDAGVEPGDVSYVEAHGTGTPLGDPIETGSIVKVFGENRHPDAALTVGSVKTNIGHLEAAAGVASLIKVVLALQNDEIPPHLHFRKLNPNISANALPFRIPTEPIPWPAGRAKRISGISAFGIAGTNAHLVVEEAPVVTRVAPALERRVHLLAISARSRKAVTDLAERYHRHLTTHPSESLADLCFTANAGRTHFGHRRAVVASTPAELRTKLEDVCTGRQVLGGTRDVSDKSRPRVVFLFTGEGSQYVGMGRELYESQPTFRQVIETCDQLLRPHVERSVLSVLYPETGETAGFVDQTAFTQPALFALEFALAEVWRSWGIMPDAVFGHGVGEYVAACVAGVIGLEDGLTLVAERGRLMQQLPAGGTMVAVAVDPEQVASAVAGSDQVTIAAVNGPENVVIAGSEHGVQALLDRLGASVEAQKLNVSHACHSPLMEPMLDPLEAAASRITYHAPRISLISNLTGALITPESGIDAGYWRRHARHTVQFLAGVRTVVQLGCDTVVEIGPTASLCSLGRACLPRQDLTWLPSMQRGREEWPEILQSLATLYVGGADIDWVGFDRGYQRRKVALPTYPFQRQRYWVERTPGPPTVDMLPGEVAAKGQQPDVSRQRPDRFFEIHWKPADIVAEPTADDPSVLLIFADQLGIGQRVSDGLRDAYKQVVVLSVGDSFERRNSTHYRLRPSDVGSLQHVVEEVFENSGLACGGVVYLRNLSLSDPETTTDQSWLNHQLSSCEDAVSLLKILERLKRTQSARLWLVTRGAQAVGRSSRVSPGQSTLWGIGRTVHWEHPDLRTILVDLDPESSATDAELLVQEVHAGGRENQIAYRSGRRCAARLAQLDGDSSPREGMTIRSTGTYLVTGGLGGVGLHVVRWLVREGARHLVLVGRGAGAAQAREALSELEQAGATITVEQADVARESELSEIVTKIQRSGEPLRGVFHAAGVLDDGILVQLSRESFAKVLSPKVLGAWNLHVLTQQLSLDCFLLFSSAASLFGSPGQGNYAAANSFLDALAHLRCGMGLSALSINWGPWKGTGMSAALSQRHQRRSAQRGIEPIDPDEAVDRLGQLMDTASPQVAVLSPDWSDVSRQLPAGLRPLLFDIEERFAGVRETTEPNTALRPPGALLDRVTHAPHVLRPGLMSVHLQQEFAGVLNVPTETVSLVGDLFELGLDSLMAMEVINRLKRDLGFPIYPREIYERPSIDMLAQYLVDEIDRVLRQEESGPTVVHALASDPEIVGAVGAVYSACPSSRQRGTASGWNRLSAFGATVRFHLASCDACGAPALVLAAGTPSAPLRDDGATTCGARC